MFVFSDPWDLLTGVTPIVSIISFPINRLYSGMFMLDHAAKVLCFVATDIFSGPSFLLSISLLTLAWISESCLASQASVLSATGTHCSNSGNGVSCCSFYSWWQWPESHQRRISELDSNSQKRDSRIRAVAASPAHSALLCLLFPLSFSRSI